MISSSSVIESVVFTPGPLTCIWYAVVLLWTVFGVRGIGVFEVISVLSVGVMGVATVGVRCGSGIDTSAGVEGRS